MSTKDNDFCRLRPDNRSGATSTLRSILLAIVLAANPCLGTPVEQTSEEKPKNLVAVFRIDGPLTEVPSDDAFQMFSAPGMSLKDLVGRLRKAATDPAIKAVVVLPESERLDFAQVEELRAAMALIRKEGKEIYVHADSLVMGQYALACGATRLSVVPTGDVMVPGLHSSSLHVRGLLDKIGVKPDFLAEGAYKSAAEVFMREQPSAQADEMMNWLLDSWYASFKEQIA